jgi:hypothetical protein
METLEQLPGPVGFGAWFPIAVAVIGVLIVAVFAYVIVVNVKNRRSLRRGGHDPDTIQAELAKRVLDSDLLAPSASRTPEDRLAEVDRLHARGAISADERAAARAKILAE